MDPDGCTQLGLTVVGLLAFALTSAAEAAFEALGPTRLGRLVGVPENASSQETDELVQKASSIVSTIALVRVLTLVATAAQGFGLISKLYASDDSRAFLASAALVGSVVISQVAPRTAATERAETIARAAIRPARALAIVLGPLVGSMNTIMSRLMRLSGTRLASEEASVTGESLRHIVDVGEGIHDDEREMIHGIFGLEETTTREIMVPRIDIAAVPASTSLADLMEVVVAYGHSRIPVYDGSIDTIVGIAYAKDLFEHVKSSSLDLPVQDIMRPPYFIPEAKKVHELLRELQRMRVHIAIVVDEYGGTSGMVTIEDLIEEIVGEIQDEYDSEEERILSTSEDEAVFDGMVSIADVNQTLDVSFVSNGVDTIGGLVYQQLGRVPNVGDELKCEGGTITVLSVVGRRIKRIRVRRDLEGDAVGGVQSTEPRERSSGEEAR